MNSIKLNKIVNCARCGKTHHNLIFNQLDKPVEALMTDGEKELTNKIIYTHFCLCPFNDQPILLKINNE